MCMRLAGLRMRARERGWRLGGRELRFIALAQADVILSLDADFLYDGPRSVRYAREFADRRRITGPQSSMNRFMWSRVRLRILGRWRIIVCRYDVGRSTDLRGRLLRLWESAGLAVRRGCA